jgi:hypothetical protein
VIFERANAMYESPRFADDSAYDDCPDSASDRTRDSGHHGRFDLETVCIRNQVLSVDEFIM